MRLISAAAILAAALTGLTAAAPAPGSGLQQVVQAIGTTGADYLPQIFRGSGDLYADRKKKKHKHKHKNKKHEDHNIKRVTSRKVRRNMKKARVIPHVIEDFRSTFLLNISFSHSQSPYLGRTVQTSNIQSSPHINLYAPPKAPRYRSAIDLASLPLNNLVVTMTDPDAPSHANPAWSEMCHWIAIGLPLNLSSPTKDLSSSSRLLKEIMPWKPPGPPPKTGKHRYVLLAFTPKNATSIPLNLETPKDREHWGYGRKGEGAGRWAEEMGLLPIAGDFFLAEH